MTKFIGRGWQYSTHDLGNGRVLKKYNTRLQSYLMMFRQNFPYISYPIWKFSTYYDGCRDTALSSMVKIRQTKIDPSYFGNPKVLNELDYEQDKVVPLHEYFKAVDTEHGKKIIDEFIKLNIMLIGSRLIDKSFLIGKNYGIDAMGRVILIDLGELYSSDEGIRKQIQLKPWDHPYVTATLPKRFREYFVSQMNEKIRL